MPGRTFEEIINSYSIDGETSNLKKTNKFLSENYRFIIKTDHDQILLINCIKQIDPSGQSENLSEVLRRILKHDYPGACKVTLNSSDIAMIISTDARRLLNANFFMNIFTKIAYDNGIMNKDIAQCETAVEIINLHGKSDYNSAIMKDLYHDEVQILYKEISNSRQLEEWEKAIFSNPKEPQFFENVRFIWDYVLSNSHEIGENIVSKIREKIPAAVCCELFVYNEKTTPHNKRPLVTPPPPTNKKTRYTTPVTEEDFPLLPQIF